MNMATKKSSTKNSDCKVTVTIGANDIMKYLKLLCFGDTSDSKKKYKAAINRAYCDFCRTIRFKDKQQDEKSKSEVKRNIISFVESSIKTAAKEKDNQVEFDKWHKQTCEGIIKRFSPLAKLNYGQAQKWLNMTLKYLLVLDVEEVTRLIHYLHIPVDNNVIKIAKEEINIPATNLPWSKWEYNTYVTYQEGLRKAIGDGISPIIWELDHWKNYTASDVGH